MNATPLNTSTGRSVALAWTTHVTHDATHVALMGEFDLAAVEGIREGLFPVLTSARGRVGLDLGALEFIDSTGIAFLLDVKRKLDARGVSLVIDEASPIVRRVLDVTGLGSWFSDSEPLATVTGIFDRQVAG